MKIAMLTNNYKPFLGGVPISVERQATELRRLGHKVTVFAPDYGTDSSCEEDVVRYGVRKTCMKNGMVYPRIINRGIVQYFEKNSFDCIHVHHPMFMGSLALRLGKKHDIPVIYTYHTRYEDYLHYLKFTDAAKYFHGAGEKMLMYLKETAVPKYMTWFTNQCDMVFAPTASMKEHLLQAGTHTSTVVFPTGLAEEFFEKSREAAEIRETYGKGCRYLFSSVSRLEKEKNPEFLLRGIRQIKKRLGNDFRVLIVGDGSMRAEIEMLGEELGISDNIVLTGNVPNEKVKQYLQASDLFLFASKSETQGIVLAEAMAAGNPVIAVEATGVVDIVQHGKNGYMTAEQEEQWADCVVSALEEKTMETLQSGAKKTAYQYHAVHLAKYAETIYMQAVAAKEQEGMKDEGRIGTSILQLFKTS